MLLLRPVGNVVIFLASKHFQKNKRKIVIHKYLLTTESYLQDYMELLRKKEKKIQLHAYYIFY